MSEAQPQKIEQELAMAYDCNDFTFSFCTPSSGVAIRDIHRLGSSSEARKLLNLMVLKMDAMDIIYIYLYIWVYL